MKSKKHKTILDYPKQIGAAWYLLGQWISKVDYVEEFTNYRHQREKAAANPNSVIAAAFSKNDIFKPQYLGLSKMEDHFSRQRIIFYKSDAKSPVYTGYGRSAKQARSLPFASDLNIKSKKRIKKGMRSMLLAIDIDCHNGQPDAKKVQTLIRKYFKDIYWEKSTGGLGKHGYLKIIFPEKTDVDKLLNMFEQILSKLNEIRVFEGLEATIDRPTGTPLQIQYLDENPYKDDWETLFGGDRFLGWWINNDSSIFRNYIESLNITRTSKKECLKKPYKLEKILEPEKIKATYRKFISDNNICFNPPVNGKYYSITVGQAIKLPLFNASECTDPSDNDYGYFIPDMKCLKRFQRSKIYQVKDLERIMKEVNDELNLMYELEHDDSIWDMINDKSYMRKIRDLQINQKTPNKPVSKEQHKKRNNTISSIVIDTEYAQIIEIVRNETDIMKRSSLFINAYISHKFAYPNKPTPDQAEQEYIRLKLNRTPRATKKRRDRFEKFIDGYKREKSNVPLDILKTWDKNKDEITAKIKSKIQPDELFYNTDKDPRKLKLEEIGFVYHIVLKQYEMRTGVILDGSLSNKQIDTYFMLGFGCKCGRNKSSAIKKLLIKHNLILEMKGYTVGFKGKSYVPVLY